MIPHKAVLGGGVNSRIHKPYPYGLFSVRISPYKAPEMFGEKTCYPLAKGLLPFIPESPLKYLVSTSMFS